MNSGVGAVTVKLTGTRLIVSQAFAPVSTFFSILDLRISKGNIAEIEGFGEIRN